ncbi:MAG TPA: hypothetical protein VF613_21490 [Longimicrobium sp.]
MSMQALTHAFSRPSATLAAPVVEYRRDAFAVRVSCDAEAAVEGAAWPGISLIRERAAAIRGTLAVRDVYRGTEVELALPGKHAFAG